MRLVMLGTNGFLPTDEAQTACYFLPEPGILPGGGRLTYFLVDHGQTECVGYRLDWPGHSLAYVTDTVVGSDLAYLDKISGVNLLLHEANNPEHLSTLARQIGHSSTLEVARLAARAQVGRLVMIHKSPFADLDIRPDLEAARRIFPASEVGEDCMEVDF